MNDKINDSIGSAKPVKRKLDRVGRRNKKLKVLLIIEFVFMVLFIIGSVGVYYVTSKFKKLNIEEIDKKDVAIDSKVEESLDGYTNIALFGVDTRTSGALEGATNSDSIIIVSINNKTKEIKMVSVYRDTVLMRPDIDDTTQDDMLQKANNAYAKGGAKLAISMLNRNLDLDISEYVTVDWTAVATAIDLLGGIDIEISELERQGINDYIDETSEMSGIDTSYVKESGVVHLDGVQATTYCRLRNTSGDDFARTARQRLVINLVLEKVKSTDLSTINKIIDQVAPLTYTSFTPSEMTSMAKDVFNYELVDSQGFPSQFVTGEFDDLYYLGDVVVTCGLEYNVKHLHEFLFPEESYSPSNSVRKLDQEIIDATGVEEYIEEDDEDSTNSKSTSSSNSKSTSSTGSTSSTSKYNNSDIR